MDSRYRFTVSLQERRQLALFRSAAVAALLALLLVIAVFAPSGQQGGDGLIGDMPPASAAAQLADDARSPAGSTLGAGADEALHSAPEVDWMQQAASQG